MGDRLRRDGTALLVWMAVFVVVGAILGLALLATLDELIVRAPAVGYAVNVVVTAVGGTAGTVAARRLPRPDGVLPEPRWVLLVGPVLVTVLSLVPEQAWDAAFGGMLALLVTVVLLAGDRGR